MSAAIHGALDAMDSFERHSDPSSQASRSRAEEWNALVEMMYARKLVTPDVSEMWGVSVMFAICVRDAGRAKSSFVYDVVLQEKVI